MSAWSFAVTKAAYGLVPTVDVTATRKCGRVEAFTAYLFPAGWRMNAGDAPAVAARGALQAAKAVWS